MKHPTLKTIVADYLRAHGYDGLCRMDCGCALDDLMPCDIVCDHCRPAYNHPKQAKRNGSTIHMTTRRCREVDVA